MIIQTAPAGQQRLAMTMSEHTALCQQLARAFGNDRFEALVPLELMVYVISNHDAGWSEFDRNPAIDQATGLPYNLVDTPPEHITVTSRLSPDFNQRHHPFCGLISSMGVVVLALVGNAAENSTAIQMAMRNQMDLSLAIAVGSSMQIAIFVAPLLVFAGHLMGRPLGLEFTILEVAAVMSTCAIPSNGGARRLNW